MSDKVLWWQAYIAAVSSGCGGYYCDATSNHASLTADRAVKDYRAHVAQEAKDEELKETTEGRR
jgi:hypothetical protein